MNDKRYDLIVVASGSLALVFGVLLPIWMLNIPGIPDAHTRHETVWRLLFHTF